MCGLFGTHKGHKISTGAELKKLNDEMAEDSREFLKSVIDFNTLKGCTSYGDYLQAKAKEKVKACKGVAMKVYEVS